VQALAGFRGLDLTDLDGFADGFPHAVFERLRRDAPMFWHEPTEHTPDAEGFWSICSYVGALAILKDPTTFSSNTGGSRQHGGTVLRDLPGAGKALNMMDDPRHTRVRQLVSRWFTPRAISRLEEELRAWVRQLLDTIVARGGCDAVTDLASRVPVGGISIILGVPEGLRRHLYDLLAPTFDFANRQSFAPTAAVVAAMDEFHAIASDLIEQRRAQPQDDLLTVIARADVGDDEPLSGEERSLLFSLLFGAGAENTRNAISGGLLQLVRSPDQLALLAADPSCIPRAVEEILRWTSPAAYNRRTATRDVSFLEFPIRAGDKVVHWIASANRDHSTFHEPMRFDARRDPNPHLALGLGNHFCLGASLARVELRVLFEELISRIDDIELLGEPEWTRSNKNTGLRHLPVAFRQRATQRRA
jgi:cytochrome P450